MMDVGKRNGMLNSVWKGLIFKAIDMEELRTSWGYVILASIGLGFVTTSCFFLALLPIKYEMKLIIELFMQETIGNFFAACLVASIYFAIVRKYTEKEYISFVAVVLCSGIHRLTFVLLPSTLVYHLSFDYIVSFVAISSTIFVVFISAYLYYNIRKGLTLKSFHKLLLGGIILLMEGLSISLRSYNLLEKILV